MDNFFTNCPAKMSDGRHMTDYRPHTQLEEQIKLANNIIRDDEMRIFLQNNAGTIINREWEYLKSNRSCHPNSCVHASSSANTPQGFSQELAFYNNASVNNQSYACPSYADYRLTSL